MVPSEFEELEERRDLLDGWPIRLMTCRTGGIFVCKIDNVDPGTLISRGEGRTREEAERVALTIARAKMTSSKRLHDTLSELRLRVAELDKRLSEPPPSSRS